MSDTVQIHRVQFRMRSGENARELENLAWKEFENLKTTTEKQRFLSEHFLAGYALNRAGITRDASVLGLHVIQSDGDSQKSVEKKVASDVKSTVNKETQAKMGSLISV